MNKILLVARREFLTRVQKKTFLLTTIGVPLLIAAFYAALIYFQIKSTDHFSIAVLDQANVFSGKLENKKNEITFKFVQSDTTTLKKQLDNHTYEAYIYIPAGFDITRGDSVELRSGKTLGMLTREDIERTIGKVLEEKRLLMLNVSKAQIDSIQHQKDPIKFTSVSGQKETDSKVGISYLVGMIAGFLIYIILFVYGTMVMRGVMEEKVSRIAEVIVSSVKPFQLMMGKITGIGMVGLVQFLIWFLLVFGIQFALPLIFPELASTVQQQPMPSAGAQAANAVQSSGGLSHFMEGLQTINFPLIIGCFIFYFLGGYFLYSSLFAAVGSAVNEDPQDAQSLLFPIMMPIIFAIVIMTKAVNDPNSSLAIFGSLFPFTSPIVMMARIAHGIPEGVTVAQLIISMVLLIVTFLGTTWVAAKIYRIGILMYGKKITWKEMIKWTFRKS
ncbi:MAG: ABC transporter permease [Bacteroidetes bacterium]|nr:ABC transporter permease [Bacteroidota bacterium]